MNYAPTTQRRQSGFTLAELMIASTLGMLIILAITGLVISSKSAQSTQIEADTIQDAGRFALDNISRSVRQAGYINYDQSDAPFFSHATAPGIMGLDNASVTARSTGIGAPAASRYNASDLLAIRFSGSGVPEADNTVFNCAGFGVPAATTNSTPENNRGWSIYYVSNDVDNEPALFCKYLAKDNDTDKPVFSAQAIVRGVESFQVLYRIENSQFQSASEINALDSDIPDAELSEKSYWKKVTAIKVALLIRGEENSRPDSTELVYHLFGKTYNEVTDDDKGTQINESDMPASQKKRFRHLFSTTIHLRNSLSIVSIDNINNIENNQSTTFSVIA